MCGVAGPIEAAHVRIGSGAGVGQKPDDWRCVSLCGTMEGCHHRQHTVGEAEFWKGRDVEALIEFFIRTSPRRAEIEQARKERGHAS